MYPSDIHAAALVCVDGRESLPEDLCERFTQGECDAFSDALHAATGWPVVVVGDGDGGHVGWVHAGVLAPTGMIVDALGHHDPADWLNDWAQIVDAYGESDPAYSPEDVDIDRAAIHGWCGSWPHLRRSAD